MKVHCDICFQDLPVQKFQFVTKCGHGFCKACIKDYKDSQYRDRLGLRYLPCPKCRKPFDYKADLHPIFIEIVNDSHELNHEASTSKLAYSAGVAKQAKYVTRKIQKIDFDTPVASIERGADEIKRVISGLEDEYEDTVQALLDAVSALQDRIVPRLEEQKNGILALQTSLAHREARVKNLEDEAGQSQRLLDEALNAAGIATGKLSVATEKNETLQQDLQAVRQVAQDKDEDIKRLQGWILRHKEKEKKQNAEIARLQGRVEEQENEIQTLHSAKEDFENEAKQARWECESQRSAFEAESHLSFADSDDEFDITGLPSSEPDFGFPPTPPASQINNKAKIYDPRASVPSTSGVKIRNFSTTAIRIRQPQRPKFSSDWAAPNAQVSRIVSLKRKRSAEGRTKDGADPVKKNFKETLGLDRQGKVVSGTLQLGDRRKIASK